MDVDVLPWSNQRFIQNVNQSKKYCGLLVHAYKFLLEIIKSPSFHPLKLFNIFHENVKLAIGLCTEILPPPPSKGMH